MYRGLDYGHRYYDVRTYEGDVIDIIDVCGDAYNIVEFKREDSISERIPENILLTQHFNAYNEKVIPHKLNYFDFDKPLKFYVGETEEEEEDEDEQIIW